MHTEFSTFLFISVVKVACNITVKYFAGFLNKGYTPEMADWFCFRDYEYKLFEEAKLQEWKIHIVSENVFCKQQLPILIPTTTTNNYSFPATL